MKGLQEGIDVIQKAFYSILTAALVFSSFYLLYQAIRLLIELVGQVSDPIDITRLFKVVIILTLSIAIFDLAKATAEEELIHGTDYLKHSEIRRGLTRFLTAITVATSIEVLMLIFKFSLSGPRNLLYAALLLLGLAFIIVALGLYSWMSVRAEVRKDRME